ncbi:MAG: histidinol dehydrogenase [Dysgonamonadaceae bacterium]|jgi:histidinol dehydrogenase|nr:histidinol dehydrogenase [Dysgonamonadaceae bacterium]
MKRIEYPSPAQWQKLVQRPSIKKENLFALVDKVFTDVQSSGDEALRKYSREFDRADLKRIEIPMETARKMAESLPSELKQAIETAKNNVEKFHLSQRETPQKIETAKGVLCWRESRAIEKVGIYIPGGSAPLFSTVLMLAVPAKIAGCKEIILCSPPDAGGNIHPAILFAAVLVGVTRIFAVGGIQAIGAMVFGTESVPKVDKIFGPGNQYVMAAKQAAQLQGAAIDMPAGPSEVLIIADKSCVPAFVAADLLSQAEHGADSQVVLLSDNNSVINEICDEIKVQLQQLPRKEIADKALANSTAILLGDMASCIAFSNVYAPEHLILAVENAESVIGEISNAGSVFLGNFSCESAGDYASGTNHTLPTSGFAKAYSGVSLDSFIKKITFQRLSAEGLKTIGAAIETMAGAEQLEAHKNAVSLRLKQINKLEK